ncbi:MAG: MBL fold metallo-hydrolase, partial [Pseudomonadota bacterium]
MTLKHMTVGAALLAVACTPNAPQPTSDPAPSGTATEATRIHNQRIASRLPLDDQSDMTDASRGFIAAIEGDAILNADGEVVWSIPQFDFLETDAPDTVNPSLWRQSHLAA